MVRQADMERTVLKKAVFIHNSLETGVGVTHHGRLPGGAHRSVRRQREQGKSRERSLLWLLCKGMGEAW